MTHFNVALILTVSIVLLCSLVNGQGVTWKNRLVSSNSGTNDFESSYRITNPSLTASTFKRSVKKTPIISDLTTGSEIKTSASSIEVNGFANTTISPSTRFSITTLRPDDFLTYSDGPLKYSAMSLTRNDVQTGPSSKISTTLPTPAKTVSSVTSIPDFSTSAVLLMSDFTQGNRENAFTNKPTADIGTPAELKTLITTSKQFENTTVERDVLQTNSILPTINQSISSIKSNFWTKIATVTAKKLSETEKVISISGTRQSSLLSTFIQGKGNLNNTNPTTEIFASLASLSKVVDLQTPWISTATPKDETHFTMSTILPISLSNETSFTASENSSSLPFNSYTLGPAPSQINTTSATESPRVLTTKNSLLTSIVFTPVVQYSKSENFSTPFETKSGTSTTRQRPTETKLSPTKGFAYSRTNYRPSTTNSMNDRLSTVKTTGISMRPFANGTTSVDSKSNSYVVKTKAPTVNTDVTVTKPSTAFEAETVENLKAISSSTATNSHTVKYLTEAQQTVSSSDMNNSKESFPSSKVTNIFTMMSVLPNTLVLPISNDTENMSTQNSENLSATNTSTMHSVTSTSVKTAQQSHDTENTEMTWQREMTTDSMKATTNFLPTTSTLPATSLIQTTETPSQTSNIPYTQINNTNTSTISITPFKATRSVPSITFVVTSTTFSPVASNKITTNEHPTSAGHTNSTASAVTIGFYDKITPTFITTKSDLISSITSETSDHKSSTFKLNNSVTNERTITLSSLDPLTVSRSFSKPPGKDNITTQFAAKTTPMLIPRSSSIFSHSFSTIINFTGNVEAKNIATTISPDGKTSHSQYEAATNISLSSLVPSTTSRSSDFVTTVSKLKTTKETTSEADSYSESSNISSPSSPRKPQTSVLTSHSTRKHIVHSTDTYNPTLSTPQTVKNPANTDSPSVSSAKAAFSSTNTLTRNSVAAMDDRVTYEPTTITTTTNLLNSFDTSTKTEANSKTIYTYFTKGISNSIGFQTFWSGKVSRTITSTTKTNVPTETSTLSPASSNQNKFSFTNAAINSKKTTKLGQTNDSTGVRVSNSSLVSKPPFTATVNSTVFPCTQTVKQNFHVKSTTISTTTPSETKKYSRATTAVVKPPERSEADVSTQTPLSTLDISSTSNIRSVKPSISIFNSVTNTRIATVHAKASSRTDNLEALTTLSGLLSTDNDNISAENISRAVFTVSTTMPHVTTKVYPDFSQLASDMHFAGSAPPITGNVENFTGSSSHNASTRNRDLQIGVSGFFRQNSTSVVVFTAVACLSVLISGMIFYKTKAYKKNIQPDRYGNICPKRLDTNSRPIFHRDVLDFNITTLTKTPPPMKDFKDTPPIWPPKENTPLVFTSLKLYHRPPHQGKISIKNFLKTRVVPTDSGVSFTNLDASIEVSDQLTAGRNVYTIVTSDDDETSVTMTSASSLFEINPGDDKCVITTSCLATGTYALEFLGTHTDGTTDTGTLTVTVIATAPIFNNLPQSINSQTSDSDELYVVYILDIDTGCMTDYDLVCDLSVIPSFSVTIHGTGIRGSHSSTANVFVMNISCTASNGLVNWELLTINVIDTTTTTAVEVTTNTNLPGAAGTSTTSTAVPSTVSTSSGAATDEQQSPETSLSLNIAGNSISSSVNDDSKTLTDFFDFNNPWFATGFAVVVAAVLVFVVVASTATWKYVARRRRMPKICPQSGTVTKYNKADISKNTKLRIVKQYPKEHNPKHIENHTNSNLGPTRSEQSTHRSSLQESNHENSNHSLQKEIDESRTSSTRCLYLVYMQDSTPQIVTSLTPIDNTNISF